MKWATLPSLLKLITMHFPSEEGPCSLSSPDSAPHRSLSRWLGREAVEASEALLAPARRPSEFRKAQAGELDGEMMLRRREKNQPCMVTTSTFGASVLEEFPAQI